MKQYQALEYIKSYMDKMQPLLAYKSGCDQNAWEAEAKAKLTELLGLPMEECEDAFAILQEQEKENHRELSFEFQSEEGYFVPCELLIPKEAKEALPVVICLQGHSSGKHISMGIPKYESDNSLLEGRDFAIQAVKEGFCAVVLDQRYMGESGHGANGTPGCICANQAMPTLLMGRTAIGERVWDVMRLIDVMEKHLTDYIDKDRIMCLGNSGGGTTTFYAACLEERICLAVPSCAVCTYEDSIVALHHCCCNYVPGIRKYFNMGDLGCLIAPRKLIVTCGIRDEIFPLKGVEESFAIMQSAYKDMGCEANCHLVKGNGGHQFYPKDVWPIVHDLLER